MAISFRPIKYDRVTRYPLAASQTIAVGDPVALDANGKVIVGTAVLTSILGVAATACTASTALDPILVYDDPKAQFVGNCDNSAQNLQAVVGDTCDLVGSTGAFLLNLDATSVNIVKVLEVVLYGDPLLDGSSYPFQNAAQLKFEIALHQLKS